MSESRRTILPGVDVVVRGEGVEPADAVLAEIVIEMATEAGGHLQVRMDDRELVEELIRRLRAKGIDPHTMG